ncbi:hypothetical protein INT43_008349 [Umbelopsis isabellina]|uniref:Methyltransferase domain-containing protein n=1 Tax=Mortierella isabellina TaxID=91625 RepID=A0A8H7U9D7_MORIS|nr:hypothetical protein INT43_008349 [Umbelopsis isabellina]
MNDPDNWSDNMDDYLTFAHNGTLVFAKGALDFSGVEAKNGNKILDVACGTGSMVQAIIEKFGPQCDAQVLATDFAKGMVDAVEKRAKADGWINVKGQVQNAMDMTLPDSSFDAVFCVFCVMLIPDPAKALSEMLRVAVPGGTVTCVTWNAQGLLPMMQKAASLTKNLPAPVPFAFKGWADLDFNKEQLQAAGFREVRGVHVPGLLPLARKDIPEFVDSLPRNPGMKAGMFSSFTEEEINTFKGHMRNVILESFGDKEHYGFEAVANVVCGTK